MNLSALEKFLAKIGGGAKGGAAALQDLGLGLVGKKGVGQQFKAGPEGLEHLRTATAARSANKLGLGVNKWARENPKTAAGIAGGLGTSGAIGGGMAMMDEDDDQFDLDDLVEQYLSKIGR